jgi:hypothetical protein
MFKRRIISYDISEEEARELMENRVKFKLYAAEQHLKNLKNLEQNGSSMRFFKERVRWEMEIESFLFYIVGVWDSLLDKINNNWELRLKGRDININNIKMFLNYLNEQALLINLVNFMDHIKKLKEWRNQTTHRDLPSVLFRINIAVDDKPKVFFRDDPDKKLEVIPFLEDSLRSVKTLLQEIIKNEPRLR